MTAEIPAQAGIQPLQPNRQLDSGFRRSDDEKKRMEQQLITRIVEAALLAASQPLTITQLHALFIGDALDEQVSAGEIDAALQALQAACADRGVELVEVASGWRFQVKAEVYLVWRSAHSRATHGCTSALTWKRHPLATSTSSTPRSAHAACSACSAASISPAET